MIKEVNITISNKKGSLYETQINLGKHSDFKLPSFSQSIGSSYAFPHKKQTHIMASLVGLDSIVNFKLDIVDILKNKIK